MNEEQDDDLDIEMLLRAELTGKSVLLLEDEVEFSAPIMSALYAMGVEIVLPVLRGEVAVREGTARAFDILLFDRENPGQDGLEALRSIRASDRGSHLSPAIITGRMNSELHRVNGLLTGADDYVNKAVGTTEIMARMVSCLAKTKLRAQVEKSGSGSDPKEVRNGPLLIRKLERVAYYNNEIIENLGAQSFDILQALAEFPGKPFTHDMLYEVARPHWKGQRLPEQFENGVHKAMKHVRDALSPFEATRPEAIQKLIVTLRGTWLSFARPAGSGRQLRRPRPFLT